MSLEEFPSPTGVLYLLIRCNENYRLDAQGVSVPYWGSLSSNSKKQETPVKNLSDIVSVPYWGSLSSNYAHQFRKWKLENVSVPYWGSLSSNPASANPVFMRIDYSLCVAKNIFIILIPKVIYNYQFVQ